MIERQDDSSLLCHQVFLINQQCNEYQVRREHDQMSDQRGNDDKEERKIIKKKSFCFIDK